MKQGPLADGSDFGVRDLKQVLRGQYLCSFPDLVGPQLKTFVIWRDALAEASTKADSVYTPILDAAQKASRLRSTLTVFERNKFFFNLPTALLEAIEHVRMVPSSEPGWLSREPRPNLISNGRVDTTQLCWLTRKASTWWKEADRRPCSAWRPQRRRHHFKRSNQGGFTTRWVGSTAGQRRTQQQQVLILLPTTGVDPSAKDYERPQGATQRQTQRSSTGPRGSGQDDRVSMKVSPSCSFSF